MNVVISRQPWLAGILALVATIGLTPLAASAAAPAPAHGLARSEVVRILSAAQEFSHGTATGEHLSLDGKIVNVPDGSGGTLTAVPVVRWPTADGYGQMVLFWHDETLVGSDRLAKLPNLGEESSQLKIVSYGTDSITVRFWRYRPTDPMYAPSLTPEDVTYRWNGQKLLASAPVPQSSGNGLGVRLPYLGLTRSEVLKITGAAVESGAQGPTGEHLQPFGKIVTVPDGYGGTLTAVPVVRWPTADAYGQMVLFWHDTTLIGSMQLATLPSLGEEVTELKIVNAGTGAVTVRFWRYRPQDALAAPSLPTQDNTYRWTGSRLVSSAPVPKASVNGLAMSIGQ